MMRINEGVFDYPGSPFLLDWGNPDSGYEYHTFAVEILPHEIRFLYDSNVVRRIPDRLIPRGTPYYDVASTYPRLPVCIRPGEMDIDANPSDTTSGGYLEKKYFEAHADSCSGCWPYHGQPAAHHLLDYVKVWDVPADVKISGYPN
jgi:hypothetical protein